MSLRGSLALRPSVAGLATLPAALGTAEAIAAPAGHPDAELIRLGQEWEAAWDRAEVCPDEEFDCAVAARMALEERILAMPAAGLAGLGVKARMAEKYHSGTMNDVEAAFLQDALRLAAQAED